jgi:hypothetical protein
MLLKMKTVFVLIATLSLCLQTPGMVITALSPSFSDVKAAYDKAASGDTIEVPAGSASWVNKLTLSKPIHLQGAGIGETNITAGGSLPQGDPVISLSMKPTETGYEISGFTFATVGYRQWGILQMGSSGAAPDAQFRLHDCRIEVAPSGGSAGGSIGLTVWAAGYTTGLIDHCLFRNTSGAGQSTRMYREGSWTLENCPPYKTPQQLGKVNTIVIEDCTFDNTSVGDGALDAYDGARFVFRHNTLINTVIGWHGSDSGARSCRQFEVYQNTFKNQMSSHIYTMVRIRGGTGVIWGNTGDSGFDNAVMLSAYRADPGYSGVAGPLGKPDGNFSGQGYYALLDQCGYGSFPANTSWPNGGVKKTYDPSDYQALDPIYAWDNKRGTDTAARCTVALPDQSTSYIKPGRDYYDNTQKPGYTPLAYPHPLVAAGGRPSPTPSPAPSPTASPSPAPSPTPSPAPSPPTGGQKRLSSYFECGVRPPSADASDRSSVELGMRFSSSVDGQLLAIRFYKHPQASGAHTGSLWDSNGSLMRTVAFDCESAEGWQEVILAEPIPIKAGASYTVSYHTSGYADSINDFSTAKTNPPISTPISAGVYSYGESPTYPTKSWQGSNYFVDVVLAHQ